MWNLYIIGHFRLNAVIIEKKNYITGEGPALPEMA
jgi:hypothetical protein